VGVEQLPHRGLVRSPGVFHSRRSTQN